MAYSPEAHRELVSHEEKKLNKEIAICRAVKETVESDGWKNTIGPLIDRMIIDTVGGKIGDTWVSGKLDRAKKDEMREFHIGFKQSLMELHSRVMFHLQQLPMLEEGLANVIKEKQERYRVPLIDDTRYRPEE
jgi:hypothetical protein